MSLIIKTCIHNWLKVVLDATKDSLKVGRMLTLDEFIRYTKFQIDKYSMDKFYYNLNNDLPIYIDNSVIEWFGYKGTHDNQKLAIRKLLQNNFIEHKNKYWFEYSNTEYLGFYYKNQLENSELNTYPNPTYFKGKNKTKHMIVHPVIFKNLLLLSDTKDKLRIYNYFITLENLIKKYHQYQCEFYKLNFENEYKNIMEMDHNIEYNKELTKFYLNKKLQDIYKIGYVYYIQEEESKNIKIGYTFNLDERLTQLQTANSQKLSVVKYEKCIFPRIREQELHKQYKNYHIRGEWFKNMF
jgi:hypothetical protein